jgi:chorismate mutase / prephenate dehydratase
MSADPLSAPIMRAASPLTVEALRAEIDEVDEQLLALIERRQRLAGRIGAHKSPHPLKLHPGREARVIARLGRLASPDVASIVGPVWRELIGAGLAVQQQIKVAVWPAGRDDLSRMARARFGAGASYQGVSIPEEALDAAADGSVVAVLALRPESAWWTELLSLRDLRVFDTLGGRGPLDPVALVVGRVESDALARGIAYRVARGGGGGAAPGRILGVGSGWRLSAVRESGAALLDRDAGWVGAAAAD